MALPLVKPRLEKLGLHPKLRMKRSISQGLKPLVSGEGQNAKAEALAYPEAKDGPQPFVTDEGNYILDCACGVIEEPEKTAAEIRAIIGVVEHGLFLGMATMALVAGDSGVSELRQ